MKKLFKAFVLLGFLVAFVAAIIILPSMAGRSWTVNQIGMKLLLKTALTSPELMTQAHVLEPYGLDWYSGDLADRSLKYKERQKKLLKDGFDDISRFKRDELDEEDQISYDTLKWMFELGNDMQGFMSHAYVLEQMDGAHTALPNFMINTHKIEDERGLKNYLKRIQKFERAFTHILERLADQERENIIPPTFVIDNVIRDAKGLITYPVEEHVLYKHFVEKAEEIGLSDSKKERYGKQLKIALEENMYPAYEKIIAQQQALMLKSANDHGVWHLPKGDEYYRHMLRFWTTSELSPEEVHQLGLRKVAEVQAEMQQILEKEGVFDTDVRTSMAALAKQERFLYPDEYASRDRIINDYKKIISEIENNLDHLFAVNVKAKVDVKPVPAFREKGAAGAYYMPPSLDGSKPGTFFANLRSISDIRKYEMRTLAYHEAVPGHHMQIAMSFENKDVPIFRRVLPFGAFVEGWALYAETLAAEQGYQDDPYDRLGYLNAQLFRSVRLVVDTGMHYKRWTREQGIEYMLANTGMSETDTIAEIERYLVLPGQACSYMVGQLKILALREKAKTALGESFDIREFHSQVLLKGILPLSALERVVDNWIAKKQVQ